MNSWHCMNLGDAMLAGAELDRVGRQVAHEREHGNADAAAFMRHASDGRLHCKVMVYFPPAAADVARALNATPCARPARGDLGLLVGAADALARWFGDG